MKIAIRLNNWVGDVVMSIPAVAAIRESFPDAEVVAVARPWVADLVQFVPHLVNQLVVFDDNGKDRGPLGLYRTAHRLRKMDLDYGFVFTQHVRGRLLMALSGARRRYAPSLLKRFLRGKPRPIPVGSTSHQSFRYLNIVSQAGILGEGATAEWIVPEVLSDWRKQKLGPYSPPYYVIHAGAAYGSAKRWPADRFAQVCSNLMQRHGGTAILIGVDAERDVNRQVQQAIGASAVLNLCGQTKLRESIALIAAADLVLSNDSGMMHLAGAFKRAQVAVFGPTDDRATFPTNPHARVVTGVAACRPCFLRNCPIDHRCMTSVSVDRVEEQADVLLQSTYDTNL